MVTVLDKNTALVLIDLQKGITKLPLAKPINEIIENAAKLVAAFRKAGLPIVPVNVNSVGRPWTQLRKDANPMQRLNFTDDWFDIVPEIKTEQVQ
jgi:nicotinamidase-related amidase